MFEQLLLQLHVFCHDGFHHDSKCKYPCFFRFMMTITYTTPILPMGLFIFYFIILLICHQPDWILLICFILIKPDVHVCRLIWKCEAEFIP